MGTIAHPGLLSSLLRHLPARWLAPLDAWSHGIARRRMEKRRLAGRPKPPEAPIDYKLKHWRD